MNNALLSSERQQYIKNQNKYIKQAAVFFACTPIVTIAFFAGIFFYIIPAFISNLSRRNLSVLL